MIVFGLPSVLYQLAARKLDATKCTTIYGLSPFIGAGISFIIFQEMPTLAFFISFILIIPGFYLVIMDREDKAKFKDTIPAPPPVEIYHDVRNYLTAFGFLSILSVEIISCLSSIYYVISGEVSGISTVAGFCIAIAQIVTGSILIILKRRNLTGMTMLLFGFTTLIIVLSLSETSFGYFLGVISILEFIMAGLVLFAKEKKKYCFFILFLLQGINLALYNILDGELSFMITCGILSAFLLILIFGATGLLPRFSLTKILAEDESLDFVKTGSAICYIIIALSILPWMGTYIFGTEIVPLEFAGNFSIGCGIIVGIVALLQLFVAKNRFICIIFFGVMLSMILAGSTTAITNYVAGFVMLLAGLFCLLRKKSYLLVGLLCILYGISSFASIIIHGESVLIISQFLMHTITFGLAIYLAIAVFSQNKKLPLF